MSSSKIYIGVSYLFTKSSIEQPPILSFSELSIVVEIGTIFLLGLIKSILFFKKEILSFIVILFFSEYSTTFRTFIMDIILKLFINNN